MKTTLTIKILAIGIINPGFEQSQVFAVLPEEIRETVDLPRWQDRAVVLATESRARAHQVRFRTLAALSGKTDSWEAKPADFGRFTLEVTTDEEVGAIRTSKE